MIDIPRAQFEDLVATALDSIPDELASLVDNVVISVQDTPPPGQRLLGLYKGIPLTQRGYWYAGALPDAITIYRIPILRTCGSEAEVIEQVHITVVHEIAHHFGIGDERLQQLGYG
ncbi:MAG: metallopeptidase family protein [Candidatus Nanopelagicales bacterium]|nr:metallopeptidase family protein [Candidatus Nanopelagicales bacterium]MDZ4248689.1 metallopeptidase family protein [Candidatus Nanopelagicales bacterium]MDZ7576916.1 metallopeptidase family protein [Candidatus Nanopelagicales bacterium]